MLDFLVGKTPPVVVSCHFHCLILHGFTKEFFMMPWVFAMDCNYHCCPLIDFAAIIDHWLSCFCEEFSSIRSNNWYHGKFLSETCYDFAISCLTSVIIHLVSSWLDLRLSWIFGVVTGFDIQVLNIGLLLIAYNTAHNVSGSHSTYPTTIVPMKQPTWASLW